ncbi:MAG: hypothetical protein AB8B57_11325 [Congregibacter sp.]
MMTSARFDLLRNLPRLTALGCALLPFCAVHLAYLVAAQHGFINWCIPYIDSCTSISATGRYAPASFVFRALMLPSAMLMIVFWWLHWYWLDQLSRTSVRHHVMLVLGWLACIGLILYVTVLGEIGDLWRLQRKIGTVLFFSFTFIAQLLLASLLSRLPNTANSATQIKCQNTGTRLLRVCQIMLAIGIFSVLAQLASDAWHDEVEDAIEWQLAFLLQLNFLLTAQLWRDVDWRLVFQHPEQ